MEWTAKTGIKEFQGSEGRDFELQELESKHREKLFSMEKQYFNNLKIRQEEITRRLQDSLSDYTRELLVTHLREIENELVRH